MKDSSPSGSDSELEHDPIMRMARQSGETDEADRELLQDLDYEPKANAFELHELSFRGSRRPRNRSAIPSGRDGRVHRASRERKVRTGGGIFWLFAAFVILLVAVLSYGAYHSARHTAVLRSNGTLEFLPTTILVSLDGFRADFLNRNVTPTLYGLAQAGVAPPYMLPSFPSLTFPNHFTLVTGLYPESHGIVGNTFWDPTVQKEFYYTDPTRSMQPEWWAGGEPIWVTAEKSSIRTAVHMWPGSEAGMAYSPTYLDAYNGSELLERKTHRILDWVDQTYSRPQLIAAYVPNVDAEGHGHGPNSTEVESTLRQVDDMLRDLLAGLQQRNLTEIVNVVIVSDHGMATTSTDRLIALDEIIDVSLVEHTDGWPLYGLRPYDDLNLQGLYNALNVASAAANHSFDVYLRDVDMPARYHFAAHPRIAPLWVVPKAGWAIVHSKADFDIAKAKSSRIAYEPKGLHGYDHEDPLMRAIFIATGPAFASSVKVPSPFQNIEVYNLVCDSLLLEPAQNNGTLRLPLVGIASAESSSRTTASPQGNSFWGFMKDKFHHAVDWVQDSLDHHGE